MIMEQPDTSYPVIIVGGGPVGLFLGCCLHQKGIPFLILEKRRERITHSRSLGIHPVSLELFEDLGIAKSFINAGIKIKRGLAFSDKGKIGSISFERCPKPYNYILSLPQFKTEQILEEHLLSLNADALFRGVEVTNIEEYADSITIKAFHSGKTYNFECKYLVGCDGKESIVRKQAAIPFQGTSYPDTYIMGDFSDNTNFENDAAVFLCKAGLIESFPLIGNKRRWVVKTDSYYDAVERVDIEKLVAGRIGHDLGEEENYMLSSFGVQKLVAEPMARKRIALAGDAAHVVSPIGGQGMNLGWMDGKDLAEVLESLLSKTNQMAIPDAMGAYSRRRSNITGKVIKRAEWNMKLGRQVLLPGIRNTIVWLMLRTPLKKLMARLFTMRNLDGFFI